MFWGGELEDVLQKCQSGQISSDDILFFVGYTGWEKNQLEKEIHDVLEKCRGHILSASSDFKTFTFQSNW